MPFLRVDPTVCAVSCPGRQYTLHKRKRKPGQKHRTRYYRWSKEKASRVERILRGGKVSTRKPRSDIGIKRLQRASSDNLFDDSGRLIPLRLRNGGKSRAELAFQGLV